MTMILIACDSLKFEKRRQPIVGMLNEPLSVVAVRIGNEDYSPFAIMLAAQPQVHPALLRLPAMISE